MKKKPPLKKRKKEAPEPEDEAPKEHRCCCGKRSTDLTGWKPYAGAWLCPACDDERRREERSTERRLATRDVKLDDVAERRIARLEEENRRLEAQQRALVSGGAAAFTPMNMLDHQAWEAARDASPSHQVARTFAQTWRSEAERVRAQGPNAERSGTIDYTQQAPWWLEGNRT